MQPIPIRLSQTIWTAFQAARPLHHSLCRSQFQTLKCKSTRIPPIQVRFLPLQRTVRMYSSTTKSSEVEEKVQDAKDRINDSLSSRAEGAANAESNLKSTKDKTIVHANPESSSIVYASNGASAEAPRQSTASDPPYSKQQSPLPSQKADLRSQITTRFSNFMDTFQANVFVASQRLNDLTGYTGIERLKREIDTQESAVQSARQLVKTNRARYAEAISMRSATQREVNDLLHRKHAWSPQDLERFTNIYRSDHANEQSEQKAHQELSEAEAKYEEASTRLGKSILARYHEEQIWSDKIRQMSTWGTWGLMGLNVLLFVVLQLAIEPWRRRRLVRGFEEKVEVALAAREEENRELRTQLHNRAWHGVVTDVVAKKPEPVVAAAGEQLAEAIVDAITGSTDEIRATGATVDAAAKSIESAAEQTIREELENEAKYLNTTAKMTGSIDDIGSPDVVISPVTSASITNESLSPSTATTFTTRLSQIPASLYTSVSRTIVKEYINITKQFDTTEHIVLSKRELTTKILEGMATGIALAGGITFVILRNK